jgi:predicted permease
MIDALRMDLRDGWRALRSSPGFFAAAMATLAIGIGANIVIFSIVNAMLLRPLPFGERSDRVVTLHATHRLLPRDFSFGDTEISYRDLLDLREAKAFEGLGGYFTRNFTLSGEETTAERVQGGSVTPDLFPLLGVEPMLGRQFAPEEAALPGLESVVMLTHGLWTRRYGADPLIIGRTIVVNDRARTVVGVLPPGFKFPERDQLYMPFRWDEAPRSARDVNGVGVRRAGVTLEQTQAEVDAIASRLAAQYPDTNRGFGVVVLAFRDNQLGHGERTLAGVLMAAVGLVLLIVCANLANLMLVRGADRQRAVAIRAAMGAGRARLVSGVLMECALLTVAGAALGLIGSAWALDYMLSLWPEELPYWLTFDVDRTVAAFIVSTAAFTALAIGVIPAFRASRPNLAGDLKEATRGASLGRGGQRMQTTLAVLQVAMCLALLVGANLMIRTFVELQRADIGFDTSRLATARAYLAGDRYNDITARAAFFQQVTEVLGALPGAEAAAITSALPGDDGGSPARAVADGRTEEGDEIGIQTIGISPGFFDALGIGLAEGRPFTGAEMLNEDAGVALVNRALAGRLWPGQSPIDRRIGLRRGADVDWLRIVGVAPDVHFEEVGEETDQSRLSVYVPYSRNGSRSVALLVRTGGDPRALLLPLQDAARRLSAGFPVFRLMTMAELRRVTNWEQRFFGMLMGGFAATALLLACLGVYTLVAYSVGRRSREIAVRLALGARPWDVTRMFLVESARVAALGAGLGVPLALALSRGLSGILYGVHADSALLLSMLAPLVVVLLVATWLPAHRVGGVEAGEILSRAE